MIYFQPVVRTDEDGTTISAVPFTTPARAIIEPHNLNLRSIKYQSIVYDATIYVNDVAVWTRSLMERRQIEDAMNGVINKINNLAAKDAGGIYDLME